MPPSPNKSKTFHKSTGKLFRHKEKNGGNGSSLNGNASTSGLIKKDESIELHDCPLTLPDIQPVDHTVSLLRYHALASGDGVSMEELDALQLELELLLSSVLVRHTSINGQLTVIEQMDKGKLPLKVAASPGKRLRQSDNDRPIKKNKDSNGKAREVPVIPGPPPAPVKPPKVKCSVIKNEPLFDVPDLSPQEVVKPIPPKNDVTNKFWVMVDQYCQETTADDVKMLEELLNAQNDDSEYFKIPPLGKHYTLRWSQEDFVDEQKDLNKFSDGKKKIKLENPTDVPEKMLREVDMNGCNDDVAPLGSLTQRIIAGLVEENVLVPENIENKVQGMGVSRPGFIKNLGLGNALSLEKRIKKELQEQGILEPDNCPDDEDDEIFTELKRCQAELRSVSSLNHTHLTKLVKMAREALVRHDLKKKLRDSDAKVIEIYKNISATKQKKKIPSKKEKESAWKALKEREVLVRQLDIMSNNNS